MKPPPPPADKPAAWVAWRKGPGRWYRVGEAGTEAEAWRLVYGAMDAAPRSGSFSSCVLRPGERP